MRYPKWISAEKLDRWAATPQAKQKLPELLRRLVFATVPREHLQRIDFPSDAEVQRPGYDGTTMVTQGTPFVPTGLAFWELGCEVDNAKGKAQRDYDHRIKQHEERIARGEIENLGEATYVAVTPLDWQGAKDWGKERSRDNHFKDVIAYDSNALEQWIQIAPAVGLWLAQQIDGRISGVSDLSAHWQNVQATLKRPLPPSVFLVNREAIGGTFQDWLNRSGGELSVKAPSAAELIAVFCAWVLTLRQEQQDAVLSRTIIVESREAWGALASSQEPLILVASPRLDSDPELFAEAMRQGHHVLKFADFRTPRNSGAVELPIMRRFDLEQALSGAGLSQSDARQLSEASGGNFTILQRRFANSIHPPSSWANDSSLAALLLAAAWDDRRSDDQTVVSKLAATSYSDIQQLLAKWRHVPDPPVRFVAHIWEFISPVDAWENLHPLVTPTQMDSFEELAVEVLGEDNPALDLPPNERFMAAVKEKVPRFSDALRRGIAEILALSATREDASCIGSHLRIAQRAAFIVRRILPKGCSWKRWASLGDLLSLLMEANRDAVLEAMERDLKSADPQLLELFRQEIPGGIAGAAYHTGVLWSLETAGWPADQLTRVSLLLTRLTELDPGGQWANRPLASLARLFFYKWPQTLAPVSDRIDALGFLCRKQPQGAWKLIIQLLPRTPGITMGNAKPSYRDWAAGWTGTVLRSQATIFLSGLTTLVVRMAEAEPKRWPELLEHINNLPPADLTKVVESLKRFVEVASDELRSEVWQKLRALTQNHTYFNDAWWALPPEFVNQFASIRDSLIPDDLVTTSTYLFDDEGQKDGSKEETFEQKRERRTQKRRAALQEIWKKGGISALLDLVKKVRQPWAVGLALAQELGDEAQSDIVPMLLVDKDTAIQRFARTFAAQQVHVKGRDWAEAMPTTSWTTEEIGVFAAQMPFDTRTWEWVASKGELVEGQYWIATGPWGGTRLGVSESERAAKQLQRFGRPWTALEHLMLRLHDGQTLTASVVCDALEAIASAPEQEQRAMDAFNIHQAFEFLQNQSDVDEARVAHLEFTFLVFLNEHSRLPLTLHRQLARDPEFFVECLKVLYRPRHAADKEKEPRDSAAAKRAEQIWHLLREWRTIPGTTENGISVELLRSWISEAREKARQCDRLEVCDLTLGELFARSPKDQDQAKPVIPIREIIEDCESSELERGLSSGFHNLRGVYSKSLYEGGKQERELAAEYERYAQICSPWPRSARVLQGLADDYLRLAEDEDEEMQARD